MGKVFKDSSKEYIKESMDNSISSFAAYYSFIFKWFIFKPLFFFTGAFVIFWIWYLLGEATGGFFPILKKVFVDFGTNIKEFVHSVSVFSGNNPALFLLILAVWVVISFIFTKHTASVVRALYFSLLVYGLFPNKICFILMILTFVIFKVIRVIDKLSVVLSTVTYFVLFYNLMIRISLKNKGFYKFMDAGLSHLLIVVGAILVVSVLLSVLPYVIHKQKVYKNKKIDVNLAIVFNILIAVLPFLWGAISFATTYKSYDNDMVVLKGILLVALLSCNSLFHYQTRRYLNDYRKHIHSTNKLMDWDDMVQATSDAVAEKYPIREISIEELNGSINKPQE